jgi:hypothetical protein
VDTLATALGPAFAAGFAVQQLLEVLDPLVTRFVTNTNNKKLFLGLVSLAVGLALAASTGLRVLLPLMQSIKASNAVTTPNEVVDIAVTGLIVSAGTEGFNSILKFIGYKKEEKKAEAAKEKVDAAGAIKLLNRQ